MSEAEQEYYITYDNLRSRVSDNIRVQALSHYITYDIYELTEEWFWIGSSETYLLHVCRPANWKWLFLNPSMASNQTTSKIINKCLCSLIQAQCPECKAEPESNILNAAKLLSLNKAVQ